MFRRLTSLAVTMVQRYLPDPFLFCIILTLIVLVGGMLITGQGPMAMITHWNNGFWNLLTFSMQMVLVLVTGHTLAQTPLLRRLLQALARPATSPGLAILSVTFVSAIACLINWGFGLIIGALYARQLARQVPNVDYRLLVASAYAGYLLWHGGFSGSIPLTLATPTLDLAGMTMGAVTAPIPTSETIFAGFNITLVLLLLVTVPFLCRAMHPPAARTIRIDPVLLEEPQAAPVSSGSDDSPATRLENSPLLSLLIGAMGVIYLVSYFLDKGFALNLNIVNFLFLFAGILLHGTPRRFIDAVTAATRGAGGIILQFPFYAGIMGMMTGANAEGLSVAGIISGWFVAISTPTTFPLLTFLSAGIVNMFVPSGGGQWAVQAPIMMPAGAELGVPAAKTAMAIAWGDAWTNMIQPFWALPALAIAGLGARDIMGYCLIVMLYSGIIIGVGLMVL